MPSSLHHAPSWSPLGGVLTEALASWQSDDTHWTKGLGQAPDYHAVHRAGQPVPGQVARLWPAHGACARTRIVLTVPNPQHNSVPFATLQGTWLRAPSALHGLCPQELGPFSTSVFRVGHRDGGSIGPDLAGCNMCNPAWVGRQTARGRTPTVSRLWWEPSSWPTWPVAARGLPFWPGWLGSPPARPSFRFSLLSIIPSGGPLSTCCGMELVHHLAPSLVTAGSRP